MKEKTKGLNASASFAFNVWLGNKQIDTVFYQVSARNTIKDAILDVRRSLINHDGYDSEIKVTWPKGQRITETEYVIQGNYGQGWEDENFETTHKDAKRSIKEYRENGPGSYRLIVRNARRV